MTDKEQIDIQRLIDDNEQLRLRNETLMYSIERLKDGIEMANSVKEEVLSTISICTYIGDYNGYYIFCYKGGYRVTNDEILGRKIYHNLTDMIMAIDDYIRNREIIEQLN